MSVEGYSIEETASILKVSRSHVYRLISRGKLTVVRNPLYAKGGPVTIPREQVNNLLVELEWSRASNSTSA